MSSIQSVPGQPEARAGLDADAPRRSACRLVAAVLALLLSSSHVVGADAGRVLDLRVVPDQALDRGLDEDADELAVDLAEG